VSDGILGQLEGVLTGIRQLRRVAPLETEEVAGLRVPTLAEMARIKAWLLATRFTTRDYLDAVVLFERLGEEGTREALRTLDELYPQPGGESVLAEVIERLGAAQPLDAAKIDLTSYRGLQPPWNDWQHVASRGRAWARIWRPSCWQEVNLEPLRSFDLAGALEPEGSCAGERRGSGPAPRQGRD
jgi:hypothetical protein